MLHISTYADLEEKLACGPPVHVLAADTENMTVENRKVFADVSSRYSDSMFLRFAIVQPPLCSDPRFLSLSKSSQCLIVNNSDNKVLTENLLSELRALSPAHSA